MSTELRVGIVVLIAIGVLGYFIINMGETGWFESEEAYMVNVRFDSIAGIAPDAPVRLAGVRVGRVSGVDLSPEGQALVTLRLDPEVRLRDGAIATVASMGILGEKYVELTAGTLGASEILNGGFIEAGAPVSIDQMVVVMNNIASNAEQITASLTNVFGTEAGEARMQRILDNLEAFSGDLGSLVQANRSSIDATTGNIEQLTASLSESLPPLVAEMRTLVGDLNVLVVDNEARFGETATNLRDVTESFERSAGQLEEIMSKINTGDGTVSRLINEPETVEKMNNALDTVDDSLNAFDTFFNRVGQAQFSFSLRSEYYIDSEATKNYFGFRLGLGQRNNRALILELVDDNIGALKVQNSITDRFNSQGELINTIYERKTISTQGFRFSALLAGRFGGWQFRGGLMENSVGGGADYYFGSDRWRLSFEAWDFGRDPEPHLKIGGRLAFFERLFIVLGYDDVLSTELRQVYVGAGFTFK
jgi:phospholipid/cholesterol/gamma-HCH transport system substrate-binding protein